MKRMVSLILGLAVAGIAAAGVDPPYGWTSEPMTLYIESGTRQMVEVERLAYDAAWVAEVTNGVTFKVSVNGAEKSQVGAYGALDWHEKRPGTYAITAQAYQVGALVGETFAATFAVAGHDLVNAVVSVDAENVIYDGTAKRPAVVVCLGGKTLVEGQDYTLTLYNNDAVGVGRMVIAGKGAYSGTVERTFRILASATCELDINDGIRIATDDETIRYSNVWSGETNSTVRVSVKDVSVVEEKGTGDWIWTPGGVGLYTFRHTTFTEGLAGEELSAQFYVPGEMTNAAVALAFTECLYDGTAACPKVVVTQAGKTLVEGLDYTVSYALNDRPGTAVVTVRGARGETYEATFTIRPACRCTLDLESGVREASANEALTYDMAWDGATSAKIAVNGAELATVAGVGAAAWQPPAVGDYTVTYRSYNGRAKTDTELSARFHVTGHDLVNAMIALPSNEVLYDGTALQPKPTIVYQGETLVEGVDYSLAYANNIAPGVATMTIRGADRFLDVIEKTFTIRPAGVCTLDLESGMREASAIEALSCDMAWDGATSAKIAVNGVELSTVTGVGVVVWHPTAVGDYLVTYRSYSGSTKTDTELSAKFHVMGQDLVNATIALDNEHILYDGTPREPKVTIAYGDKTLIEGVDYALSYANNIDSGVATMTITGKGTYQDVLEVPFAIIPAGVCFLDIESGVREAKDVEPLTYDDAWHGSDAGNTEMKILVQPGASAYATTLVSGLKDVGQHDWQPNDKGQVTVTLRTYVDGYYLDTLDETAVFNVVERMPLEVTHFAARPRYPWNGQVDIDLTFTGDNRAYEVTLIARDLVGGTNLPVRTVGTAGEGALTLRPGTHRLTWSADADIADDAVFERVSMTVRVE